MNLVFQLASRPDLKQAQQLSTALDRQPGVTSALVDPQLARVFVTYEPDMTGDMALQRVVEGMGFQVSQEGEGVGFTTEMPGYLTEVRDEESQLDPAVGMLRDAEFGLPDREGRLP